MRTQLYIDGKWVDGSGKMPVYDPSDGSVIAEVEAAIAAAHRAQPEWVATAPRYRSELLRKAFELMTAESDMLAELVSRENGKVFSDAKGEVAYAAEFFRWFAKETVRVPGISRQVWPPERSVRHSQLVAQ